MAFETIGRILEGPLVKHNLKWCFVSNGKIPYRWDNKSLRINKDQDFSPFEDIVNQYSLRYIGVGISVNFSNIVAIDIDKCLKIPFDIKSIDKRGSEILSLFQDYYSEISFSGTGIRILFWSNLKVDFVNDYFVKNSKNQMEIYFPNDSYRYVTITGRTLSKNDLKVVDEKTLLFYLDTYMKRNKNLDFEPLSNEELDKDMIEIKLKKLYHNNPRFLDIWTSKAPGSGKNESELDYYLISTLMENITSNIKIVKNLFENSEYFLSKDQKHLKKWYETNYFDYTISSILRRNGV